MKFAPPIVIAAVSAAGAAVGDSIEHHNVSVATVVSVAVFVCTASLWLGKKFQSIEDRFDDLTKHITEGKAKFKDIEEAIHNCVLDCPLRTQSEKPRPKGKQ